MRTSVIFALVAVALTAVLAAPAPQHTHHHAAQINVKQIQPTINIKLSSAVTRDWLSDLIDAITGSDVVALLRQIEVTLKGLDQLVKQAETELEDILANVSQEATAEIQAVVDEALREAVKIIEPILGQLGKVMPIVSKEGVNTRDISSIISAVLGRSLEDFLNSIKEALVQLEELLNVTSDRLQQIAQSAAQSAATQIQAVIDNTIAQAKVVIKPLLDILEQIFGNNKAVARQHRDLIADIIQIIENLLGINIGDIVAQIPVTVQGVEAALLRAAEAVVALVESEAPAVAAELNTIVTAAVARAREIVQPLLDVLAPVLGGGRHMSKDLIGDLVEIILGVTLEELVALINETAVQLDNLVQETLAQVQAVADRVSAEVGQQAQAIVADAVREIEAAVQPLLDLLAPLLPPPSGKVSIRKMNKDLIEDAIQIIGALLGIDIKAIFEQIPVTVNGVERELGEAFNALVALLESTDASAQQKLEAIVNQAVARAQEIVKPLLDLLAPLIPSGKSVAVLPKDLLDDLLQIILGVTLDELVALVKTTVSDLDELLVETVAEIQRVASEVSAELVAQVSAIVDEAVAGIEAEVQPLLDLLAPLLPPPTKAIARQHRDLIADIIQIIENLLGINIGDIVAQIPVTVQGVEAALQRAAEAVVALVEAEAPAVAAELNDIVTAAVARAREIVQPLLDVLAPVLGGSRHMSKDLIGDLVEIILGVTLEELVALINNTAVQLDNLIQETLAQVQAVADRVSAEVGQQAQAIVADAVREIEAAVQPLLDLLAPLLPPPSGKVSIRKMNKDLIEDAIQIIGALLGIDIKAIFEQIPVTINGVERELGEAVDALVALLESTDASVQQKLEAIVNQAVARAQEIVKPLLDLLAPLIPSGKSVAVLPKDLLDDLLQIILGVTLEELVALVNTTVRDLDLLLVETVTEIQNLASEVSAELVAQVSAIISEAVVGIEAEVQPLLDLLAPLLPPPTKAVARQHRDLIADIIQIIENLLGINIGDIVAQIPVTVQGVEAALLRAAEAVVALVESEAPAVAAELNTIVTAAVARAREIVQPLLDVLAPVLGGGRHMPKDLIGDLVEIILGVTLEELVTLINETAVQLDNLVQETLAQVQAVADRVSAEVGQQAQVIVADAVREIEAAVQPLLDLLAPLLPPPSGKVSIRKMNKDLIEDAIQIIGALLGIDIKAIFEQIPVTVNGVERELGEAVNALVALLESTDASAQQKLEAIVNQAVARAQEIVKPLLDLLAPLIPSGKSVAVLPKDLLDDLLQIILGVTLDELVALVKTTVGDLDELLVETVAEIQRVASEVSAELVAQVSAIVDEAVAGIEAEVQPLLDLLAPLLPPPTKAVAQHRDLIADIIQIIENLLGINIGDIVAQIPVTVQGVEAALQRAAEAVVALVESEAPAVAAELNDIVTAAVARAREIVQPLLDVLAPVLGGGRHMPKDLIGDLVEIILGVTLEELVNLINETAVQLDNLVQETLAQVQAVADRVSAEVGQQAQAIVAEAVSEIEAAVQPLLDLLAPLLPPPTKAIAARDPIQDLIQIISELLGIDVAAVLKQAQITQAEIVAILDRASIELEAILAAGDSELAEKLDAIINAALAEGQQILQPLLDVLAPIVGGGNGLRHLNKDLIGDLVEALLGITLKELIEITTTTLINLEALFNRTLDEIARVATEVSAEVDAQVQAVLQRVEQEIAAALQPLIDLLAPLLPGGGSKIAHHNHQKDLISDLIDLIGNALGVDLAAIVEQARRTAQGVSAAINLADSELNALLEGSDLLERVEAISAAAEAEGRAILQPLVDVVQQTIASGSLPITVEQLVALVESTVSSLEALALRTVGQIQEEVLAGAGAELVPEVRRILRELILEINAQVAPLLELLEGLRPTPAPVSVPRMRLINHRGNLRIKAQ